MLNEHNITPDPTADVYEVDIVIIHGLNGNHQKTWTHDNGTYWPQSLLPTTIPGARIFSFGYPSQIFATRPVAGIRDFAKDLLSRLGLERDEDVSHVLPRGSTNVWYSKIIDGSHSQ